MNAISCDEARLLWAVERGEPSDDAAVASHLDSCPACARVAARDAVLADSLVRATAAASRFRTARRRAGTLLLAATVIGAFALSGPGLRPRAVYVIRGDASGVTLTGPGISRRGETIPAPPAPRKGDRT